MAKLKTIFIVGYLLYMSYGFSVTASTAQSLQSLGVQLDIVENMTRNNIGLIAVLEERVRQNSKDIDDLKVSTATAVAAMNTFTGIGLGLGAIGTLIMVMQAIQIKRMKG